MQILVHRKVGLKPFHNVLRHARALVRGGDKSPSQRQVRNGSLGLRQRVKVNRPIILVCF